MKETKHPDGLYVKSLLTALNAHQGHYRKSSKNQYLVHLLRVSELVLKEFGDREDIEFLRSTALLHDVLEDTWITKDFLEEEFGKEIAWVVFELTEEKVRFGKKSHAEYIEKLRNAGDQAKIIKLLDVKDNVEDGFQGKKWFVFLEKARRILEALSLEQNTPGKKRFDTIKKELLEKISVLTKASQP